MSNPRFLHSALIKKLLIYKIILYKNPLPLAPPDYVKLRKGGYKLPRTLLTETGHNFIEPLERENLISVKALPCGKLVMTCI